jgi:PTS system mannose-specific IID component
MIPAIKKLYSTQEEQSAALKRHLEFYNTHPYVSAPIIGVTLALEEERANGAPVEDQAIQGVKVGMMGPLAGVGDPVFWFTVRPILGALGASMALGGSIVGPLLFFVLWNVIRMAFLWYTQEFGYNVGTSIAKDFSGGLMGKITEGASILGMFIIGALVQRWVSIGFTPVVSTVTQSEGAYIDWASLPGGIEGVKAAFEQYAALGPTGLNVEKVTTLQGNLDQLIPGLAAVLLTLLPFRKMSFRAKIFTSWVGIKGAGPILFALSPLVEGLDGASYIFDVVFVIVLFSLLLQGTTLRPVAKALRLSYDEDPQAETFGMDIPEEMGMLRDHVVTEDDIARGSTLRDLGLPHGIRVMMVRRGERFLVPHGSMPLEVGDHLIIIMGESDD